MYKVTHKPLEAGGERGYLSPFPCDLVADPRKWPSHLDSQHQTLHPAADTCRSCRTPDPGWKPQARLGTPFAPSSHWYGAGVSQNQAIQTRQRHNPGGAQPSLFLHSSLIFLTNEAFCQAQIRTVYPAPHFFRSIYGFMVTRWVFFFWLQTLPSLVSASSPK